MTTSAFKPRQDLKGILRNLTPHSLYIYASGSDEDPTITLPAPDDPDSVPRLHSRLSYSGHINGVPVHAVIASAPSYLPDPEPGVYLVCSTLVAGAANRPDVLSPGNRKRDSHGRTLGCIGLIAYDKR